jgi:RHS repeat-associated protein
MVARIGCRPGCELPAGVVDLVGNLLNDQAGNMTHDGLNQYTYDADPAGNVLNDGVNAYLYDIEGRLCAVENLTVGTITQYVYDAEGTRVAKGKLSWTGSGNPTWNTACSGITGQGGWTFTLTTSWVLGQGGEQVTELDVADVNLSNPSGWAHTNVFAGGALIATYDYAANNTLFALTDWLGTKRVEVGANPCATAYTSLPFGDSLTPASVPGFSACQDDATENHFTGKERDTESGNDYFGARYYASSMGRWMSPDPSNLGVDFFLPQTWNRYEYALNNPLTMMDRNGFWPTWVHNDIIDKSFPTLSSGQRDILKKQSAAVDEDQSVAGSHKHGMVGEGCDGCFDAQGDAQKTADWISQNEHDAEELQQQWIDSGHTGLCPAALQAFGNALHTITNMTSPSHEGGQHWTDNYGDLRTNWHVLREIVPTDSNKRRQQTAIQNAQRAFWQVFGSGCHTEQTTTTIYDSNGNSIGGSVSTHLVCN